MATLTVDAVCKESDLALDVARSCEGEWAGWQCDFSSTTGELIPLPDRLVPAELSDWGLSPAGFELLTSEHTVEGVGSEPAFERRQLRVLPATS